MQIKKDKNDSAISFLQGGGEMGELIRHFDWSKTPIGDASTWPQNLRTAVNILLNSQFPMFVWWGPELITIYNDAYHIIAGDKHPKALGESGPKVWSEIWDDVGPLANKVMQEGSSTWSEDQLLMINRHGYVEETYFTFSYSPVYDDDGAVCGVFCACTETTEKVLAAKRIKVSEQRFRTMVMQAPVAIAVFRGQNFVAELANNFYLPLVGRTREDFVGKPLFESLPEARETLEPHANELMRTGKAFPASEFEMQLKRNGQLETCYFNSVWEPLFENEIVDGFIVVAHEITDQVVARKKLEGSEAELQKKVHERTADLEKQNNLLDNILTYSSNGISVSEMIRDKKGKIIDAKTILANDAAIQFTGLPKDIYLSKTAVEIDPNLIDSPYYQMCINTLETGKPSLTQYYLEFTKRWLELTVSKMDDDHLIHIFTDVTPIKESQLQLEKYVEDLKRSNANLEEFAYAASHDLKEPVRKIHFFADRLKKSLDSRLSEEESQYFERMELASTRMGSLIDDLLNYSQLALRPKIFEEVNLDQIINLVLNDLDLEAEIKKAKIMVGKLFTIQGHHRQLQQAFQNLVSNALKYSKPGVNPEINISGSKIMGKDSGLNLSSKEQQSAFYVISIKDNGIGFEQKDADRIFNVFTRLHGNAEYKGTGIGLSITRKVIENHNGYIRAESKPGEGATFKVYLPVTE